MNVHKDDTVLIIAGKDKSTGTHIVRGRVRQVIPEKNQVIVEGVNVHRKHTRGRSGARQAGIIEIEAPLDASKVMVVCPKCGKGTRVGHIYNADGTKSRQCRNCGETLDNDTDRRWSERAAQSQA